MLTFIERIIGVVISAAFLVHGYFYIRYNTFDPCAAASLRYWQDSPANAPRFDQGVANKRDGEVLLVCYAIALLGVPRPQDQK
jgi:hypothetical protein